MLYAIGEIALVVIGILIVFQINSRKKSVFHNWLSFVHLAQVQNFTNMKAEKIKPGYNDVIEIIATIRSIHFISGNVVAHFNIYISTIH